MLTLTVQTRMPGVEQACESLGVDERGRVQSFLTARVLFHMRRYMPWLSGHMATAQTRQTGPAEITVDAPQARYLWAGSKMKDPNGGGPFPLYDEDGNFTGEFRNRLGSHPVPTGEPLTYTRTVNEAAGDHWELTLMANERQTIAAEVTQYAKGMQ